MKVILRITPVLVCALCAFAGPMSAQTVPAADLRAAEAELDRRAAADAATEQQPRRSTAPLQVAPAGPDPFAPAPGGPCFEIRAIDLVGFEAFGAPPAGYDHLVGSCATAADIGAALNQINQHYQDTGYITTRAYVPQQDVADGSLAITIVPGRIERYTYGDGRPGDARLTMAFPRRPADLLSLRDLEQGLENINALRSASGQFELIPGETEGGSVVSVNVTDGRPWHFDLSLNNTGVSSTGEIKGSANLGFDNLLNLNDEWRFGVTTTPFEQRGTRYSDSYTFNLKIPLRGWSFGLNASTSDYVFPLQGINQQYQVAGDSKSLGLTVDRLLSRNQTSKVFAYGTLTHSRARSYIDRNEILSQRRRLSVGVLGLKGERNFAQSKLSWDLGGSFGLSAFDATVPAQSIVDPNFSLAQLRLDYDHRLSETISYKGTFFGQHSDDVLPGSNQFSIGGWSNVRGFHDDSMYGDTGAYLRNTVEWVALKRQGMEVRPHAGLDFGYVEPSALRRWSQNYLVGTGLGVNITFREKATLTLRLAHALSRPEENPVNAQPAFEASETVGYAGFRIEF